MRMCLLVAAALACPRTAAASAAPHDADAERTLRQAAERGDARAEYELGHRLARGGDRAGQAAHWYRKAAAAGDADALRALTDLEASRGPGPKKGRAALERAKQCARARAESDPACEGLFVAAANEGSAEAQCDVGAARLDAAAAADFDDSVHDVARRTPRREEKGVVEGVGWLRASAEQGWPDAQYRLGRLLEEGVYVDRDPKAALSWYRRAADQGNRKAWDALDRLESP